MKKKLMLLVMIMIFAISAFAGCGRSGGKTVSGTFMDKKDFMFTVQDDAGTYYGFNFDTTPENYEDFENGDSVTVTYTGTISEVDPFDGEILSIEKNE